MLTKAIKKAIQKHADNCAPNESCGLIVSGKYVPCNNIAPDINQFEIDPRDLIKHDWQKVQAIVHNHTDGNAELSEMDRKQMTAYGLPWVILGNDGGFLTHEPVM